MKSILSMFFVAGVAIGFNQMLDRGYIYCGEWGCTILNPWGNFVTYSVPSYPSVPYSQFPPEPSPSSYTDEMQSSQKCHEQLGLNPYDWDSLNKQRYCI